MIKPVRIRLCRREGFNLQAWSREINGLPAVNCARPGRWGNPYVIGHPVDRRQGQRWGWIFKQPNSFFCHDADAAVRQFAASIGLDEAARAEVRARLGGHNLACWCAADAPCHADVLLHLANSTEARAA